jgi:hypothetical protein
MYVDDLAGAPISENQDFKVFNVHSIVIPIAIVQE